MFSRCQKAMSSMSLKRVITLHCKFFYTLLPFSRETTKLKVYGQRGQTFVKFSSFPTDSFTYILAAFFKVQRKEQ